MRYSLALLLLAAAAVTVQARSGELSMNSRCGRDGKNAPASLISIVPLQAEESLALSLVAAFCPN
jgi:hypothetical protein